MDNIKSLPKYFKVKTKQLSGSSYREVHRQAIYIYKQIKHKTKRKSYIRSTYFKKQKVFFSYFWKHLSQHKNFKDKVRRLKLFSAAIELIENSNFNPSIKKRNKAILYRFYGKLKNKKKFVVQIKHNLEKNTLQFMSVFPWK